MNQEQAGLIMLAVMVLALSLAAWGWSNKKKRYRALESSLTWSAPTSTPVFSVDALYVATTEADQPLKRVAVSPLSYRSRALLDVHPEGLVVTMRGSAPFLIPTDAGLEVGKATWTIDRVVEPDGLVMVRWILGEQQVDSYFRIVDADPRTFISHMEKLGKGIR
jgi:hypothetical protein